MSVAVLAQLGPEFALLIGGCLVLMAGVLNRPQRGGWASPLAFLVVLVALLIALGIFIGDVDFSTDLGLQFS